MAITVFLPVRKGSERIIDKNTCPFAGIEGGLLQLKLNQLSKLKDIAEIIVSTNDEKCFKIASSYKTEIAHLKIVERPEVLGTSDTVLIDLIKYAGEISSSTNILWTHVTSPLFDDTSYRKVIEKYEEVKQLGFDGLISGKTFKDYLIDTKSGRLVNNFTPVDWPRTQDLKHYFKINNAVFLTSKGWFQKGNRSGKNPFYMEFGEISSLDIDWQDDFKIAEAVYEKIYR